MRYISYKKQQGMIFLIFMLFASIIAMLYLLQAREKSNEFFVSKEPIIKEKYIDSLYKTINDYYTKNAADIDAYAFVKDQIYEGSPAAVFSGVFNSSTDIDPRTVVLNTFFKDYPPFPLKYGAHILVSEQECDFSAGLLTNTTVCGRKIAIYFDAEEGSGGNIPSYFTKPIKNFITGRTQPVEFKPSTTAENIRIIDGIQIERFLIGETISTMLKVSRGIEKFGRTQFLQDPTHDIAPNYFKAEDCANVQLYELGCSFGLTEINQTTLTNLRLNVLGMPVDTIQTAWGTPFYINNDNGNPNQVYHILTVAQTAFPPYTASLAASVPWFKPVLGSRSDNSDAGTGLYIKITQQLS